MKRLLVAGLVVLISAHIASTPALAEFDIVPAGTRHDGGYGLCVGPGGELIGIGVGSYSGSSLRDLWLFGPKIKSKLIGGSYDDCGFSVQPAGTGYIMVGQTKSYGAGEADVWLVKTNNRGEVEWQRTFGGATDDCGYDVQQTTDKGFIIVGSTNSYGAGESDVLLIKTRRNGGQEWMQTFGGPNDEVGYSVKQTIEGEYILTGYKESEGGTDKKAWLIKTDSRGRRRWDRVFGGDKDDCGRCVIQTSGGYVVAGWTESFSVGSRDAYIIKTDPSGKPLWEKAIGGKFEDCAQSIVETFDKKLYVFTGWTWSYQGSPATWLVAIRPDGRGVVWDQLYYGTAGYFGYCVRQLSKVTYAIAGICTSSDRFARGYDGFMLSNRRYGPSCCWYNTYDSSGGELIQDGAWGYIDPGDFAVECETADLVLRNCNSPTPQRTASASKEPHRDRPSGIFNRTESPRHFLVRVLSNYWIATHRVYTTDDREFDTVLLAEKPAHLCLAKAGASRMFKFDFPKDSVARIEPLVEEQIADHIREMLRMERGKLADDQQRRWYENAIKELSEKCCKHGAPYPGTNLVNVRVDEQNGKMTEAVLEIDEKSRTVRTGDVVDGFMVMGRDAETNTILLQMGENGNVTRIWSAEMWENAGSGSSAEEAKDESETMARKPDEAKRKNIPQNDIPPPLLLEEEEPLPATDKSWSAWLQNLRNIITGADQK